MTARTIGLSTFIFFLIGLGWWFWQANPAIGTGQTAPENRHPYYHLTYNKLAADHRGNFTGDAYLLNIATGETVQLTKGGTTGKAKWLNNEEMLVTYRPKGSVVDPYYLDVTTGRLSVADLKVESLLFYKERFEAVYSPSRAYYMVHIPNTDGSGADQFSILAVTDDALAAHGGAELIKTISTAGFTPPVWTPNSEIVVYGSFDQQICLLKLDSLDEVCRPGMSPVVTKTSQPTLVAFLERTSAGFHVCTAEIDNLAFDNVQCHDENRQQITDLAWRP